MAVFLLVAMLPEKIETGAVEVAGDRATLHLSGVDEGKPVHGSAVLVRVRGEWKIDVMWRGP
jgi:hypothetical protein